jgi:hypothetical protein
MVYYFLFGLGIKLAKYTIFCAYFVQDKSKIQRNRTRFGRVGKNLMQESMESKVACCRSQSLPIWSEPLNTNEIRKPGEQSSRKQATLLPLSG